MPWVLAFYGPKIRARSKMASVSASILKRAGIGTDTITGTRALSVDKDETFHDVVTAFR